MRSAPLNVSRTNPGETQRPAVGPKPLRQDLGCELIDGDPTRRSFSCDTFQHRFGNLDRRHDIKCMTEIGRRAVSSKGREPPRIPVGSYGGRCLRIVIDPHMSAKSRTLHAPPQHNPSAGLRLARVGSTVGDGVEHIQS